MQSRLFKRVNEQASNYHIDDVSVDTYLNNWRLLYVAFPVDKWIKQE